MEAKERIFKNKVTSVIGGIIILLAVCMAVIKLLCTIKVIEVCDFGWGEIVPWFILGYTYLMAKDSIMEGLTQGYFKLKK